MTQSPDISEQLLDLIKAKATDRIQICAMLSISQPTLKKRLEDHNWKPWMIDTLCRRLRMTPPAGHQP